MPGPSDLSLLSPHITFLLRNLNHNFPALCGEIELEWLSLPFLQRYHSLPVSE